AYCYFLLSTAPCGARPSLGAPVIPRRVGSSGERRGSELRCFVSFFHFVLQTGSRPSGSPTPKARPSGEGTGWRGGIRGVNRLSSRELSHLFNHRGDLRAKGAGRIALPGDLHSGVLDPVAFVAFFEVGVRKRAVTTRIPELIAPRVTDDTPRFELRFDVRRSNNDFFHVSLLAFWGLAAPDALQSTDSGDRCKRVAILFRSFLGTPRNRASFPGRGRSSLSSRAPHCVGLQHLSHCGHVPTQVVEGRDREPEGSGGGRDGALGRRQGAGEATDGAGVPSAELGG